MTSNAVETPNSSIARQTTSISCPHSDGKNAPICWDCAEQGHVSQRGGRSPRWESFNKIKKTLRSRQNKSTTEKSAAVVQSSAPEVHPPAEGLEVGVPNLRTSQPGLEVLSGPKIVSPSEKYRKPGHNSWDTELDQKVAVVPGTGTICGLPKKLFLVIFACLLLALVGTAVGVAVGLTQRDKISSTTKSGDTGGNQVSSTSPLSPSITTETVSMFGSPMASPLAEGTSTSSTPSDTTSVDEVTHTVFQTELPVASANPETIQPTASPTSGAGPCLGVNGTTYKDHGTGVEFKIECAEAHQGKDIDNVKSDTMENCVSICAKNTQCKGAIYYNAGPQGTDYNYCWLKSAMDDEYIYTNDAQSVVRL
ncbi:hypothetical protein F5B20DRAFT_585335 [Whalleya microplaca]|nr:hypothetical protein F5B20DRAFT_585335 [Whalleya microplaca]